MALRSVLQRGLPDPAEVEHYSLAEQVLASPVFVPLRLFWATLQDFRPWWPILLPGLIYLGIRTYLRERQQYEAELLTRNL